MSHVDAPEDERHAHQPGHEHDQINLARKRFNNGQTRGVVRQRRDIPIAQGGEVDRRMVNGCPKIRELAQGLEKGRPDDDLSQVPQHLEISAVLACKDRNDLDLDCDCKPVGAFFVWWQPVAAVAAGALPGPEQPELRAQVLEETFGWDILAASGLWAFGPHPSAGPNALINDCLPGDYDEQLLGKRAG